MAPTLPHCMIFTIEPMLNMGKPYRQTLGDDWTVVTRDRKLRAQAEHTVGITEDGLVDFTRSMKA